MKSRKFDCGSSGLDNVTVMGRAQQSKIGLLLGLCLTITLSTSVCAQTTGSDHSLTQFGDRVLNRFNKNDFSALVRSCIANGVIVVRREFEWDRSHATSIGTFEKTPGEDLTLSDIEQFVWVDHEVRFDPSGLGDSTFHSVFKQFRALIANTEDGYPTGIITSAVTKDEWGSRYLGPAINGKIASNEFWYIYLVKEKGEWRIWRLELAIH